MPSFGHRVQDDLREHARQLPGGGGAAALQVPHEAPRPQPILPYYGGHRAEVGWCGAVNFYREDDGQVRVVGVLFFLSLFNR